MPTAQLPVFISYAHVDQALVLRVVEFLRGGGLNVFVDSQSLAYGDDWRASLRRAIVGCERVMLFWTAGASLSKWVGREWRLAVQQGKRVVPTLLDDTPLPPRLARLQAVTTLRGMFAAPPRSRDDLLAELAARDDLAQAADEADQADAVDETGPDIAAGELNALASAVAGVRAQMDSPAPRSAPRRGLALGILALSLVAAGVVGWYVTESPSGSIELPSTAPPPVPASGVPQPPASQPVPPMPPAPQAVEPGMVDELPALPMGLLGLGGLLLAAGLAWRRWQRRRRARRIMAEVLAA